MTRYELIGVRKSSYTAKRTGEVRPCYYLMIAHEHKKVELGRMCSNVFMSEDDYKNSELIPGGVYEIEFNQYGTIEAMELVS